MKIFNSFSKLFPLWVIIASATAYAMPGLASPLIANLRVLFIVTMFLTGLVLKEEDLHAIRTNPIPVGIGVALQYLIMPLSSLLIARMLPLGPNDQIGLILTGSVPGAMASNAITYLAGGDVAYSVAMTVTSTAVSPVATPAFTSWLAGTAIALPVLTMMVDIFLTVVAPVAAGFAVRYFFTGQIVQLEPAVSAGTVLSITGIIAAVTAQNSARIVTVGAVLILGVVLLNAAGYLLGFLGARLAGLSERQQLTVAIEVGMQNGGLSTILANRYFSPDAALAGSFYTVWCVITGAMLSPLRRRLMAGVEGADDAADIDEMPLPTPVQTVLPVDPPACRDRQDPPANRSYDERRPRRPDPRDDFSDDDEKKPGRKPEGLPGSPLILDRSQHVISRKAISPEAQKVLYRLRSAGFRAFLVGGSVRDMLLGRKPKDFDVATDASPRQVAKLFRNARVIGRRFRVVHVRFSRDTVIEVATFRAPPRPEQPEETELQNDEFAGDEAQEFLADNVNAAAPIGDDLADEPTESDALKIVADATQSESEEEDDDEEEEDEGDAEAGQQVPVDRQAQGPRPARDSEAVNPLLQWDDNVFGTAEEDAFRRDLTINGLFYDIDTFSVIDYVGGLEDLKKRVVRTIGDPNVRFLEDPVRMIRAIRHASRVGFDIETNTWDAIKVHHEQIRNCSRARVLEEFLRELSRGSSYASLALLEKAGLLHDILPPLADHLGPCPGETVHQKRAWKRFEEADKKYQAGQMPEELAYTVAVAPYNDDLADEICQPGYDVKALPQVLTLAGERIGEINRRLAVPRRLGIPAVNVYLNFMLLRRGIATGRMNARLVANPQRLEQCYGFYVIDALARGEAPLPLDQIHNLPRQKKKSSRSGKRKGKRPEAKATPNGGSQAPENPGNGGSGNEPGGGNDFNP